MSKQTFKPRDGQYYYAPHRSMWGVWLNHVSADGIETGDFIDDFPSKEAAAEQVKKLNKWK